MGILEEIGSQIRIKRKELGYSQEFLGNLVCMDKTQISKVEKGQYKNLKIIDNVLKCLDMAIYLERQDRGIVDHNIQLEPLAIEDTIFCDYVPGEREIRKNLLRDMDLDEFDLQEGAKIVVERTVERGQMEDFYAAFDLYGGFDAFRKILAGIKKLNPYVLAFASTTFHVALQ